MRLPSATREELTLPDISDDAVLGGLPLVFQTLGAARLVLGDARIVPSTGTLFALLVRVAYSPEYRQSRDALLTSLWPGQSVARQRGNLRQALYKARSMGINVSLIGDSVCLDPRQVVTTFALSQTTALFDRDVIRGNEPFGVFLPGFVAPWPDLQEWIGSSDVDFGSSGVFFSSLNGICQWRSGRRRFSETSSSTPKNSTPGIHAAGCTPN
jgi:hypothetical protein